MLHGLYELNRQQGKARRLKIVCVSTYIPLNRYFKIFSTLPTLEPAVSELKRF